MFHSSQTTQPDYRRREGKVYLIRVLVGAERVEGEDDLGDDGVGVRVVASGVGSGSGGGGLLPGL